MPKTLTRNDPHLITGVRRLQRVQKVWGILLIALGIVTELAATSAHPVAGLPFIAVGLLALRWAEPALLATVATLIALSIVPTINPHITILGPDPLVKFGATSLIEVGALVLGKLMVTLTAANQFFLYRFLYGSERATTDEPTAAIIPPMVANRTDGLARSARWIALIAALLASGGWIFLDVDPSAYLPRIFAEMGGSLAAAAIGFGLGAAFSPTDERPAALMGVGVALVAYLAAALALLRLPV